MTTDRLARSTLLSFMSTRCDVSSQHKLPTESEVLSCEWASLVGKSRVEAAIAELVREKMLRRYGPYLSDRKLDVL